MRALLLAMVLLIAGFGTAEAEMQFAAAYAVQHTASGDPELDASLEGRADVIVGRLSAGTLADNDSIGTAELFLGVEPQLGPVAVRLSYTRPLARPGGALALGLDRPLGANARFAARVNLHPENETASTEAKLSLSPTDRVRMHGILGGRIDETGSDAFALTLGASRRLGDAGSLGLGFSDGSNQPRRASLTLRIPFGG